MEIDGRTIETDRTLAADVVIVGAGPAGLIAARDLGRAGFTVLLVESGGRLGEVEPQRLNAGTGTGDPYAGLRLTRHRHLGGTAKIWNTPVAGNPGAKYVPLDPTDFASDGALSGWPLGFPDLEPYYRRAQDACELGPFRYEGTDWFGAGGAGDGIREAVYQFGTARWCLETIPAEITASDRVTLCLHTTITALETAPGRERVVAATGITAGGTRLRFEAATFVAAGGAVENARLLLVAGLGNEHDWVGRCFMEHPRDRTLRLHPGPGGFERLRRFDLHEAADGTRIMGRVALALETAREAGVLNGSASLFPRWRRGPLALWGQRVGLIPPKYTAGYGWSKQRRPDRAFLRFDLLVNAEQWPERENRITLGGDRDPLGVPKPNLHWTWSPRNDAGLSRLKAALSRGTEARGWGRIEAVPPEPPDPNAHHHAGTTRMAADAADGVVDPDGRVFGVANLYLTGGSVFPRAGFANPTLTIVALAIRLADHLGTRR